ESRFLAGDRRLFFTYRTTLFEEVLLQDTAGFQRAKLLEQRKRHERFGNSLFYLEPNLKENPGGLRDIHNFMWIAKYRYGVLRMRELIPLGLLTPEEYRSFSRCREYLWRVRNALHFRAGRREDRLTFQYQMEIAAEFGYKDRPGMRGVEQFMRRYYQVAAQVGNLSNIFLRLYEEEFRKKPKKRPRELADAFVLLDDKVAVASPEAFVQNPLRLIRLFELSHRLDTQIHPETTRQVCRHLNLVNRELRTNPEACRLFLKIMDGREATVWTLRRMNDTGVLGRFIPEFGRIQGQSQHDLFHVYTVDEHTLLAVESLHKIQAGALSEELPLSTMIVQRVRKLTVLYLAVLFHDIAKGRGDDHSVKGAVITRQIGRRLGLSEGDAELAAWLVENHLVMSRVAFRLDINDPQTVSQFARRVGDQQRLDMLLLLTVADIRAVGPGVWNQWKASLLRRLHQSATEALNRGLFQPLEADRLARGKREAAAKLLAGEAPAAEIHRYLERFSSDYFLSLDPEIIVDHYRALRHELDEPLATAFFTSPVSDTTDLLVYTQDHPGLIARISGALAGDNVNILSANVNTTKDGMALDIFTIQDARGGPIDGEARKERLRTALMKVLLGQVRAADVLAKLDPRQRKRETFHVPPSVLVDNDFSDAHTVLEVSAMDRVGLLYTITRELKRQGIQIRSAKISTYGERAVDVFYVKDLFGLKLDQRKVERMVEGLKRSLDLLEQGREKRPPSPAGAAGAPPAPSTP
ncbi:MAG: [protein-PII] uridylyltransferase, partial [Magnetococcales bacterium]|nr:[protein-PII] uridylyltransferase [Magnetococcales bacterium]